MTLRLTLESWQLRDLAILRDLSPTVLDAIATEIRDLHEAPLRPHEVRDAIKRALPDHTFEVERVLLQLVSLNSLKRSHDLKPEAMFDVLDEAITRVPESDRWSDAQIAMWREAQERIVALFDLPQVEILAKSMDLAFDYANIFQRARIICDVRPVFDGNGSIVAGGIVSFTLRLETSNSSGDSDLSVALDRQDVERLQAQCERAIRKAETIVSFFEDKGSKVIIRGEDAQDD